MHSQALNKLLQFSVYAPSSEMAIGLNGFMILSDKSSGTQLQQVFSLKNKHINQVYC